MENEITIEVTKSDINIAGVGSTQCPIAMATKRQFHTSEVSAGTSTLSINDTLYLAKGEEATKMEEFTGLFDRGRAVEPTTITLKRFGT